ncbi:CvfD/Ygs/GSP13 family RNA-binding post-transcriptional regulator [Weissella soli]|uniref:CvfD/Ygs/GSP13 family RNA-binding post-transcriptional regulator n=1 Tax=Weissella soli TaxID=155866 RepID=UPI00359F5C8B
MYRIGEIVDGVVTGILPYGAFVQLDNQTQGLIHISECRSAYIHHVGDELTIGQELQVMVLDIDQYTGKISLSRRIVIESAHASSHDDQPIADRGYRHYWTNSHLEIGFRPIAENKDDMISEALTRLMK